MKKLLLFLLPLVLASIVFFGFLFFSTKDAAAKGALQVTSVPKSKVYLNDKLLGETPLCKCEFPDMLPVGNYTLRLVPSNDSSIEPFEEKVSIGKTVLTVVDRTFNGATASEGFTISLQPTANTKAAGISVTSIPDKADVLLDKNTVGQTPVNVDNTTVSDHELTIKKSGYKEKTVHIHTSVGYRVDVIAYLAIDANQISLTPGVSPATSPLPSNAVTSTISPSKPNPTNAISPAVSNQVLILNTPTGFLRVRADASINASETARVNPGDTFLFISQKSGWVQIKLSDGTTGWVSDQYIKRE